ncbi:zinc finger, CCHC-type containing protein [Tanacetum coccineum]
MDVQTTFLNGELNEEVYMNQPQGFIMSGNDNKVYKLIKSLYGLKQTPNKWHQKFDEVVLFSVYFLNQADKCVYSKFDEFDKGVIICLYVDDMLIFSTNQVQVDMAKDFYHQDTSEKLMPNNGQAASQLGYSRVIGYLMYAMACTRLDIALQWISNTEDNLSTSGWVFLLGRAAAGKEAEWLRNLILEIPLWSKPIAPISIRCDSAATLAKAYSQMYNGKTRHLGVRHNMIRELIMNGVVTKHPDSNSGKREFKLLMKFSEFTLQTPLESNPSEDVSSAGYLISESFQYEHFSLYVLQLKVALQIELLRARPTTLGESFSLARITEARFEDERSAITIAKPNDLNTRIQVQDLEETIFYNPNKVEAVKTSMIATSEEHEHQENQDNLNEVLKKKMTPNHQFLPTLLTAMVVMIRNLQVRSSSTLGKNGIGDVLDLLDSRGANNFAQPNAGTGSDVVAGLSEEFQEGDMIDALSRVMPLV